MTLDSGKNRLWPRHDRYRCKINVSSSPFEMYYVFWITLQNLLRVSSKPLGSIAIQDSGDLHRGLLLNYQATWETAPPDGESRRLDSAVIDPAYW